MRLDKKELHRLRLIRLHLREILVPSNVATAIERRTAEEHLRWVERALMEEHPDRDEMLKNIDKLNTAAKGMIRITNDILAGE